MIDHVLERDKRGGEEEERTDEGRERRRQGGKHGGGERQSRVIPCSVRREKEKGQKKEERGEANTQRRIVPLPVVRLLAYRHSVNR